MKITRSWRDIESKVVAFATSGSIAALGADIIARNGAHLTTLEQQGITLVAGLITALLVRSSVPRVEPTVKVDPNATQPVPVVRGA